MINDSDGLIMFQSAGSAANKSDADDVDDAAADVGCHNGCPTLSNNNNCEPFCLTQIFLSASIESIQTLAQSIESPPPPTAAPPPDARFHWTFHSFVNYDV